MAAPSSYTQSWGTEIEDKINTLNGQLTDEVNLNSVVHDQIS